MDGGMGMMTTPEMIEAYRQANKSKGTKATKKEPPTVEISETKASAMASSRPSRTSSVKHSKTVENLQRTPSSTGRPSSAANGRVQTGGARPSMQVAKQQHKLQTIPGAPVGKGAAVERARSETGAAAVPAADSANSPPVAHSGLEQHRQPHPHPHHHHQYHHPRPAHHQQRSSASRKRSTDQTTTASSPRADGVPSSSAPAAAPLHKAATSLSSPPRTPPFLAASPRSRPPPSPFSLSPIGAAATAAQRNRPTPVTSPTTAPLDRAGRLARTAPDGSIPDTNKALPRLHTRDDDGDDKHAPEHAGLRSRPRASSAASASPVYTRQSPLRTKQLPQLPGKQAAAHDASERKAALRRGSIDDIVPELGQARYTGKPLGNSSHHQSHSKNPSVHVDGASMPTPTNAHLMLAPLRSTTTGSMASMASGDTLVPSASGSSVSVSTTSTATRNTRQLGPKPLIVRNNRTYINDPSLPYPLPVDLQELHRQSLRTLLLFQLLGGPITSPVFAKKPPLRVLEVGCGSGFWSMMCHRYFDQKGYKVSFTGMDVIPLCGSGLDPNSKPDNDMQWKFVQHDVRNTPWPFADGEFDLVMAKDMCLIAGPADSPEIWDENIRVTAPGGVLELWETDHTIRMLRPHAPVAKGRPASAGEENGNDEEDEVGKLGVYTVTGNTPLSPPTNTFLSDYNGWITKALDKRGLSAVPNTQITPWLLQEAESLTDISSIRLAVPLSEIRWEREGVGGVVTKGDGKSYIDSSKGKYRAGDAKGGAKTLTELQVALRRTALETVVGLIHSFEPILRETSGKSQDEWDNWVGKMMNDLMREGGTSWGECLEVGAWSAKKRA